MTKTANHKNTKVGKKLEEEKEITKEKEVIKEVVKKDVPPPVPQTPKPSGVVAPLPPKPNIVQSNDTNTKIINKESSKIKRISRNTRAPTVDVVLSIRHLSLMLKSGLSISDAMKSLSTQSSNKTLHKVYNEIAEDIHGGLSLTESIRKFPKIFPPIAVAIVSVGEQAGTLEKNLVYLADYLKKKDDLNKKIKGALIYPLIILGLTVAEMLGVIFFILPKLDSLFRGFKNIPEFTVMIISVTTFIRENFLIIIIVFAVLGFGMSLFFRTRVGKIFKDHLLLGFPIINKLFKANILATFPRTLSILLESGVPLSVALKTSYETVGNVVYKDILEKTYKSVSEGEKLSASLAHYPKQFPPSFIKLLEIGEETGTLEENLGYLNEFFTADVDEMSNNLTILIEPLLLVFLGAMIAMLAITIVGPIYQLTSTINA